MSARSDLIKHLARMEAMSDAFAEPPVAEIIAFLGEIGIPVVAGAIVETSFLPGILIDRGALRVDPGRLAWPGDLLHEAGHVAVMTPARRAEARGNVGQGLGDVGQGLGDEIAAELWSYAALTHLGLPPALVFHPHGYKGSSDWLIETFRAGLYPGLPLLQWMGLALDAVNAAKRGMPAFPHMLQWLRTSGDDGAFV